jgi:hypothetical protein
VEPVKELNLDVSTEELLSGAERAFAYADLYAMLGNGDTVVWLTPHLAITRREHGRAETYCRIAGNGLGYFSFDADGNKMAVTGASPSMH